MKISEAEKYMQCFTLPITFEYWENIPINIIDVYYNRLGLFGNLSMCYDPNLGVIKNRNRTYYDKLDYYNWNWNWNHYTAAYNIDEMNYYEIFSNECSLMACIYFVIRQFGFERIYMESNIDQTMYFSEFAMEIYGMKYYEDYEENEKEAQDEIIRQTSEFIRLGAVYLLYKIENMVPDEVLYQQLINCFHDDCNVIDYIDTFLRDIIDYMKISEEEFNICSSAILSLFFSYDTTEDGTTGRLYIYSAEQIKDYLTNKNSCSNKKLTQMIDVLLDKMKSPFLIRNELNAYFLYGETKNSCVYAHYIVANCDDVIVNPMFLLAVNVFMSLYEEFEKEIRYTEIA